MKYYIGYLIFIFIQSICIYSLPCYNTNTKNKLFIILSCVELIVFTGLRADNVGADTLVYLSAIDTYSFFNLNELLIIGNIYPYRFEIGYLWITKVCAYLGMGHTEFLMLISVLIYIPTYRLFYRYSPYPILSIAIYFGLGLFGYSLGIFRQYIAMSIVFLGINYVLQKRLIKWTLVIVMAMLFHTTAILCYPLYFISRLKFQRIFFFTMILQPILYFCGRSIIVFLSLLVSKYLRYIGSQYDELQGATSMLIIYNILLFICYFYNKKRNIVDSSMSFFINGLAFLCCVQAMAYAFPILGRAIPYFSIFLTVTIPVIIKDMFPARQALVIATVCSFLFVLLFIYQNIDNNYILPFKFFWEI